MVVIRESITYTMTSLFVNDLGRGLLASLSTVTRGGVAHCVKITKQ